MEDASLNKNENKKKKKRIEKIKLVVVYANDLRAQTLFLFVKFTNMTVGKRPALCGNQYKNMHNRT